MSGGLENTQRKLCSRASFSSEVPGSVIGERVMVGLRKIDEVAYVRFASVYRRFQEATDFVQEVKKLEENSK